MASPAVAPSSGHGGFGGGGGGNNELDVLLQDLSNARYEEKSILNLSI